MSEGNFYTYANVIIDFDRQIMLYVKRLLNFLRFITYERYTSM